MITKPLVMWDSSRNKNLTPPVQLLKRRIVITRQSNFCSDSCNVSKITGHAFNAETHFFSLSPGRSQSIRPEQIQWLCGNANLKQYLSSVMGYSLLTWKIKKVLDWASDDPYRLFTALYLNHSNTKRWKALLFFLPVLFSVFQWLCYNFTSLWYTLNRPHYSLQSILIKKMWDPQSFCKYYCLFIFAEKISVNWNQEKRSEKNVEVPSRPDKVKVKLQCSFNFSINSSSDIKFNILKTKKYIIDHACNIQRDSSPNWKKESHTSMERRESE